MKKELISVIIPVYNAAHYLEKCINSIINQTYHDLEIILLDDGSTDGSGEMCDSYANSDSRIRVFHQANRGVSATRKNAISVATGDYVSFIDSDDYADPEMIEELWKTAKKTDADISLCGFRFVNTLDEMIKASTIMYGLDESTGIKILEDYFCSKDRAYWCVFWNKLFKASLFDGIQFPDVKSSEDTFVSAFLYEKCEKVAIVHNHYYNYRQRADSLVKSGEQVSVDRIIVDWSLAGHFSNEKKYNRITDSFIFSGMCLYKDFFWAPKMKGKQRNLQYKAQKKAAERLFRIAWRSYRCHSGLTIKKKLYYEVHFVSFALAKIIHNCFRQ